MFASFRTDECEAMTGAFERPIACSIEAFEGCDTSTIMPEAVHFLNHLAAERRQPAPLPLVVGFAGVRIGELVVAVVRERHVAPAAVVELLDAFDVRADRIPVLDADHGDFLAALRDADDVGGRQGELDLVRRDLFREAMNGVELGDRRAVGALVSGREASGLRGSLPDVDDEERDVEAAFLHLRQVHLRRQPHGVVAVGREVLRIDVVVGVERDDAVVDGAGPCRQILLRVRHRTCGYDDGDDEGENGVSVLHGGRLPYNSVSKMRNM